MAEQNRWNVLHPDPTPVRRRVLITGCGRSGTTYTSQILCQCTPLQVLHEKIGDQGTCSWYMAADPFHVFDSGNFYSQKIIFKHIFHQVRHPLKVITSALTLSASSWNYIRREIPEIKEKDSLTVMSAKYWYYWNLKAEEFAEWRYRIEDIDFEIDRMAQLLEISVDKTKMQMISKKTNTRNHPPYYTWSELKALIPEQLYLDILEMAHQYGYSTTDE